MPETADAETLIASPDHAAQAGAQSSHSLESPALSAIAAAQSPRHPPDPSQSQEMEVAAGMQPIECKEAQASVKEQIQEAAVVKEESPRMMLPQSEQSHSMLSADDKSAVPLSDAAHLSTATMHAVHHSAPGSASFSGMAADDSDDSEDEDGDHTPNAKRAGRVMPAGSTAEDGTGGKKKNARVSCHQCKTTKDDGLLLFCTTKAEKGKRKRKCRKKYCDACLRRSYNMSIAALTPQEIATYCCPACHGTCSCAACQRKHLEAAMRKDGRHPNVGRPIPAANASSASMYPFNPLFNMHGFLASLNAADMAANPMASLQALTAMQSQMSAMGGHNFGASFGSTAQTATATVAATVPASAATAVPALAVSTSPSNVAASTDPAQATQSLMASLQAHALAQAQAQSLNQQISPAAATATAIPAIPAIVSPTSTVGSAATVTRALAVTKIGGATVPAGVVTAIDTSAVLSPASGSPSVGSKSYAELAALSPNSLAQQQADAAAAAATTQAEIEEKTRQLQELLARRMSQDPHFLTNFNLASANSQQQHSSAHQTVQLAQQMQMQSATDPHMQAIPANPLSSHLAQMGVLHEPTHDELRSHSPTPPGSAAGASWDDTQYRLEQQRALHKLNQRSQMQQLALSGPAKLRTLQRPPIGGSQVSPDPPLMMPRQARSASHSSIGMEGERAPRSRNSRTTTNVIAGSPGRVIKRRSGASSPYSRPVDGNVSNRLSPSLTGYSSNHASLGHGHAHHASMLPVDDDAVMEAIEVPQFMNPSPPRPSPARPVKRDSFSSSSQQISPADLNYHRYVQQRSRQQKQQQQQQQNQFHALQQQQQQQHQQAATDSDTYNRLLRQSHVQSGQQLHSPPRSSIQEPSHGTYRPGELHLDVARANQAGTGQHPFSGTPLGLRGHSMFSPLSSDFNTSNPMSGSLLTPQPMHGSNLFSPNGELHMGLQTPMDASAANFPMGSPTGVGSSFTPMAPQTPNAHQLTSQQPASTGSQARPPPMNRVPPSFPPPLLSSSPANTSGGSASGSSFLFTPMAPVTPSMFFNSSVTGTGPGSGPSFGETSFDWSAAQASNVPAMSPSHATNGRSGMGKMHTSSPLAGYSSMHIGGSSILGMLSPGGVLGATSVSSSGLDSDHKLPSLSMSQLTPPPQQQMSPIETGLPQLPTA